jgi:hypothetical protein
LRCEKRVVSRAEERDVDNRAGKYILRFTARLKAVTIALPNPPTDSHGSACSRAQHCNQSSAASPLRVSSAVAPLRAGRATSAALSNHMRLRYSVQPLSSPTLTDLPSYTAAHRYDRFVLSVALPQAATTTLSLVPDDTLDRVQAQLERPLEVLAGSPAKLCMLGRQAGLPRLRLGDTIAARLAARLAVQQPRGAFPSAQRRCQMHDGAVSVLNAQQ